VTIVGAGGVVIREIAYNDRFEKQFLKLDKLLQARAIRVIPMLLTTPIPPGLRFEKIKTKDVYTIHVTGNYKVILEIVEGVAELIAIGPHVEIDRKLKGMR
jgi:plasmid maintenance system killer protein